ncbi:MAG: PQQ-binding-like beta-propeller repeat protein [Candidatus Binatia bacterium]
MVYRLPWKILGILIPVLIVASHSSLLAQRLAESPWPTYRGDLKRTGRSNIKGPATNQIKWIFSTGLSEKEGGIESDPVIGPDGTVYIGANNGIFYALDPENGGVRWAFPTNFDTFAIYSTPFVDQQGVVYFGAKDGNVYALRAPRRGIMGEVIWSINLGTTIQTSPAFTPDGTLVIGADDWVYYGITPARDGSGAKIKWRFPTQGTLITSPAVDSDGTVFVASMDGKVYALEPPKEAGQPVKIRWTFASGARDDKGGFENAPVIDKEGTLYIGGNDGILYALDTKTGKVKWTFDGVARAGYRTYAIFSSVAIGPDRTIYFGGKNGILYALRERPGLLSSGAQLLWRYKLGPGIQSSPLLAADGTVYLGDERGTFHAVRPPASGEWATALWKFSTKGTLISSPAIATDGTLYEGSMDGKLYAFKSGPATSATSKLPFSGTWYGTYESPLAAGKVRAVLEQRGSEVWATWFLEGVGRGEAQGRAEENRLLVSLPIKTARCQGTVRGEARLQGGEIKADVKIDQCGGKVATGKLTLRNR